MSKDLTTSGPSRRSIAKGAAWAVPAVSVAAAAPSLAASPNFCETVDVTVARVCPPLIGADTRSVYFTVTNDGDCTIRSGLAFTLSQTGLVGLDVGHLNSIQVDAGVLFTSATAGNINRDIPAGGSVEIEFVPDVLLNADVVGSATLTVGAPSATANFTVLEIDLPILPSIQVAICA
ncbi:MAG: hypothetical protein L0G89_10830 [Janibacter sp.]|nr:hypothetical protein [Janibacter sp.]